MSKKPASAVFTVRDLNRQPAKVLEAVRKFGSAEVHARSGEVFTVAAKAAEQPRSREFPNFEARWKKLRELGLVPPPRTEDERVNRVVAGEQ